MIQVKCFLFPEILLRPSASNFSHWFNVKQPTQALRQSTSTLPLSTSPCPCSVSCCLTLSEDADALSSFLTCNSPSDSIFSCRTSTSEKINLTRVIEYMPLMYLQVPLKPPFIILSLINQWPRLDPNQWLGSY